MIGALNGKVAAIGADSMILDVGGVGYEVAPSARVRTMITRSGQELSISIYTDVRENAIALYGFAEASERELFLLLKKVKGVGAKLALAIVSQLEPEVLLSAIGAGDRRARRSLARARVIVYPFAAGHLLRDRGPPGEPYASARTAGELQKRGPAPDRRSEPARRRAGGLCRGAGPRHGCRPAVAPGLCGRAGLSVSGLIIHALRVGGGTLAICPLPGAGGAYRGDLALIRDWRPGLVISLTTEVEMLAAGARYLGTDIQSLASRWAHLPKA